LKQGLAVAETVTLALQVTVPPPLVVPPPAGEELVVILTLQGTDAKLATRLRFALAANA
jgi:hypothetical protein